MQAAHLFSKGAPLTFSRMSPSRPWSLLRITAAPVPMKPALSEVLACAKYAEQRPDSFGRLQRLACQWHAHLEAPPWAHEACSSAAQ